MVLIKIVLTAQLISYLILSCCEMEKVDNFNFLGLIIIKSLKWNSHVDYIASKISRLFMIFRHTLPIDILVLLHVYNSLILPHMTYCLLA